MTDLEEYIQKKWSHLNSKKLIVACSGGLDSTVLLDVMHRLNFKISAIHVNYKLRGSESDGDEEFIREFCDSNKISLEVKAMNWDETSEQNIQLAARDFRYEWFRGLLSTDDNSRILLAHHSDDQLETFFLNIARNSGVMGLACMLDSHDGILRPCLNLDKSVFTDYALKRNIKWREDSSNSDNNYNRNKLRNVILPGLIKQIPTLKESALLMIELFQKKQLELVETVAPILGETIQKNALSYDTYNTLDEYERHELVRQLGSKPQLVSRLNELKDSSSGKKAELNHLLYNSVVSGEKTFHFERKLLPLFKFQVVEAVTIPSKFNKNVAYLDSDKLNGELQCRIWQKEDRIASIGMKGSQLISDIIKDAKLNPNEKNNVLVVHDDEHIHWCPNLKVGRHAVASKDSNRMVKCEIISLRAQE